MLDAIVAAPGGAQFERAIHWWIFETRRTGRADSICRITVAGARADRPDREVEVGCPRTPGVWSRPQGRIWMLRGSPSGRFAKSSEGRSKGRRNSANISAPRRARARTRRTDRPARSPRATPEGNSDGRGREFHDTTRRASSSRHGYSLRAPSPAQPDRNSSAAGLRRANAAATGVRHLTSSRSVPFEPAGLEVFRMQDGQFR